MSYTYKVAVIIDFGSENPIWVSELNGFGMFWSSTG